MNLLRQHAEKAKADLRAERISVLDLQRQIGVLQMKVKLKKLGSKALEDDAQGSNEPLSEDGLRSFIKQNKATNVLPRPHSVQLENYCKASLFQPNGKQTKLIQYVTEQEPFENLVVYDRYRKMKTWCQRNHLFQ